MSATAMSTASFDYADFDPDSKGKLIRLAGQIRSGRKKYNAAVFEVGESIAAAHAILAKRKSGTFGKWIEQECGLDDRTAANYMHTWQTFGEHGADISITTTAMYLLSAPEAPEKAAKEAIKLADKGETVSVAKAKELLDRFREVEKSKVSKSKPATIADLQPVAAKEVAEIEPSKIDDKPAKTESSDPVADKCEHEWDDDGDCLHCKVPRHEVESVAEQFKELLEHVRQAIKLVDSISTGLGGSPSKRCRDHEYAMSGLDAAHEVIAKWKRRAKC